MNYKDNGSSVVGFPLNKNQGETNNGSAWSSAVSICSAWSGAPIAIPLKPVAKALQVGAIGLGLAQAT